MKFNFIIILCLIFGCRPIINTHVIFRNIDSLESNVVLDFSFLDGQKKIKLEKSD